jgi:8-oxo-dGTP diphosphatase/2-hydroxy-dATP diphosphatase
MTKKVMTLAILYNDRQVLLAMKKRGFGTGRFNGYGGKLHEGEIIKRAALRELQEEAEITSANLTEAGVLTFNFEGKDDALEVYLFRDGAFSGDAKETDEMKPEWFEYKKIPFDKMWPDDRYWLPLFLKGKDINGEFWFKDENTLLKHEIRESGGV